MKKISLVFMFFGLLFTFLNGCKKDDDTTGPTVDLSKELFPLAIGTKLEYNEYAIDQNGNKVSGSDLNVIRTMSSLTTKKGVSAYLVIDEVYKGTTLQEKDTSYINKDDIGDVRFFVTVSEEPMPGTKFEFSDWFYFYKPSAGIGKDYTVFKKDTVVKINISGMFFDATVTINVTGKIIGEEQVTVPYSATPMKTTRVDTYITISVKDLGTIQNNVLFFQQWLSEGVGPIKESGPASSTENGYVRLLTKK